MKEIITDLEKLSERCDEIDTKKENDLVREITLELKETLREHKDGVGLSANQIGYTKRIFVINFNGDLRTFVNPIISNVSNIGLNREGCLSLPNKEYILPRFNKIEVMYQTPLGKTECVKLFGLAACVFQHELDHLEGINISDIGLEVGEDFDNASEEEKTAIIDKYLESLDLQKKQLNKEIQEDPMLKKESDAIDFMTKVQKGEVEIERVKIDKDTSDKIAEKINEASKLETNKSKE